jgi:hypothetical protein
LHLGIISETKRKSLPAIAKVVGLNNQQNLQHFLRESPWTVKQFLNLCGSTAALALILGDAAGIGICLKGNSDGSGKNLA